MFLKRLERRKNGKNHTYWALVKSIRTAKGSRRRVVVHLREPEKRERTGWAQLAQRLNGKHRLGGPRPGVYPVDAGWRAGDNGLAIGPVSRRHAG